MGDADALAEVLVKLAEDPQWGLDLGEEAKGSAGAHAAADVMRPAARWLRAAAGSKKAILKAA
jgi:hypothetical protein